MCFVRLVSYVPGSVVCMPNFEIIPLFFHFHFAVFVDDHGACSVKHVAAAGKWVGVCIVSSVCVHGV